MNHWLFGTVATAAVVLATAGCGDGGADPCEGVEGECIRVQGGGDMDTALQMALLDAEPGQTIGIPGGTHQMSAEQSLVGVNDVTIRGAGRDETVLDFTGQASGGGLLVENVEGITIEDFTVLNSGADGVTVRASSGVVIRGMRVEWNPPNESTNGKYALYPVNSENVLVEDTISIGSADAGIYVGESRNIIVRDCEAYENVTGIQVENSFDSEVYDNHAHDNAAGMLIHDLPGKEFQKNGARHLAYNNLLENNNTPNFGPEGGGIVSVLPSGLGALLLASNDVELRNNVITNSQTANLVVVSYFIVETPEDPDYDPYPERIYVHDNEFEGGGDSPDTGPQGGQALAALNGKANNLEDTPGEPVRDMVYDGISPPTPVEGTPDETNNPAYICFENNTDEDGDADFLYLDGDNIDLETSDISATTPHTDVSIFTCTGPTQSEVTLP